MRLFLALVISKLYLFIQKCFKNERSDTAGLLAARICPDILKSIAKPKTVLMITGTNGKTTVSNLLNDFFKYDKKKVICNYWNANMKAGHIRCLIDCVNIFNKPVVDVAVLECDELISDKSIPDIEPNYVIVTNICRDSIRRNSYPEYIFNKINAGVCNSKTKLILNADDPISSALGNKNTKIYVSVDKIFNDTVYDNISPDFTVCPKCYSEIVYDYKQYRHIGKFKCSKCSFKAPKANYTVTKLDNDMIVMNKVEYPALSKSIFNIYNEAQFIVLLKEMGYKDEYIVKALETITIPKSRENLEIENGIKIYSRLAKGQNSSALSTVLESLTKTKDKKQLILLLDEVFTYDNALETITWIYDSDLELLKKLNLDKVIVTGKICQDYLVRLKLAGIDEKKIVLCPDYMEAHKHLDLNKNSNIYVLYEVDRRLNSREVIKNIKDRIKNEVK